MHPDWQSFLRQQGAAIADGVVADFGDAAGERIAARDNTVLCDLSQYGALRVSGGDAQTFLQNLFSNDIRELDGARAQLSSFNTAKGRMLAIMLIRRTADGYLLQLPRTLCELLRRKLSMYVLRSKVTVADADDGLVMLGLSGDKAAEILTRQFGGLPPDRFDVLDTGEAVITRVDDTRFRIDTDACCAPAIWKALAQHATPAGSACWDWLEIRAGIPTVLPATQEAFVPQMVNLEVIGGVNFKKGCYPGQEVVARMHYLGKPSRRMYLAHIEEGAPQAGDMLVSTDASCQTCGTVVSAAPAPEGGADLLAVLQIGCHDADDVHLGAPDGPRLHFLPPPYALP